VRTISGLLKVPTHFSDDDLEKQLNILHFVRERWEFTPGFPFISHHKVQSTACKVSWPLAAEEPLSSTEIEDSFLKIDNRA
jgi:hypothetical protein